MNPQTVTATLLLVMLLAVGAVDVASQWAGQATVSQVIREWASRWPIIPLFAGMLIGHLFWCPAPVIVLPVPPVPPL